MNILIFAGGSGTRLWPISRKSAPKQLLKLVGDKTLLENTYDRCKTWTKPSQIYIATLKEYKNHIKKQLPKISDNHYSLEPVLRDRGPAIALAALIMHHNKPNSCFMTMWSDHHIEEEPGYFKGLLANAEKYLTKNPEHILTVGVKPMFPHTGFGYIEKGPKVNNKFKLPLFKVKSFKEKPNLAQAGKFVKTKNYLWNSGYFIWRTDTLLNLYKEHLPEVYKILEQIKPYLGTTHQQKMIDKLYPKMPKVEIENGIIEKVKSNINTIEANFDWIDVGSWDVIKNIQAKEGDNFVKGLHVEHGTTNSLIYNYNQKQLVTTLHANNLVVIVTPDAVLIADKDNSSQLKSLMEKLKSNSKYKKYL